MAATRVIRPVRQGADALGGALEDVGKQLLFYARIMVETVRHLIVRRKYGNVVLNLVSDITIGAGALIVGGGMIFVIFSMSFFTGTEVGLQGFKGLQQIGAQAFTGLVGSFANTREVTPLIAGVAFAAQVGAGFTAELGAMRISEEIDALEVMSVPSIPYLVCTRMVAALIAIIPLYLISLFASFFATKLVTTRFFGLSPGVYDYYFHLYLPFKDVVYSVIKAALFAVVVALIHCYYGYYASGGPAGVGVAVGRAIRLSIVVVVLLNLVLSLIFWGGGNTVSLTG
jgi:phospholipid/cholesterol/gamma-HCH transport system permease protein